MSGVVLGSVVVGAEASQVGVVRRGLRMVYDFSGGRCGARTDDGGRTVWFELAHPPVIIPNGDRP
jgi:hypothetical protein